MDLKDKAQLVIELLEQYLKQVDMECYVTLHNAYNPDEDLTFWNPPLINGEFTYAVGDENLVLDISPSRIIKIYCDDSLELHTVANFYELCGACATEEDNGSWDKTIEYMKKVIQ